MAEPAKESFLPTNELPTGVSESDLYDGPKVVHLPSGKGTFVDPGPDVSPANVASLVQAIPPAPMTPMPGQAFGNSLVEPPPYTRADMARDYPQALQLAMDILSARLLGLIALVTSCIVWGGVIYAPEPWRIAAAGAFSTLVFLPTVALYWRAGMTGDRG